MELSLSSYEDAAYMAAIENSTAEGCGQPGEDLAKFLLDQKIPPANRVIEPPRMPLPAPDVQGWLSVNRTTVGVYGNSHLRMYNEDKLVTCDLSGDRLYLSTSVFKLRGTGVYVNQPTSMATALQNVTLQALGHHREVVCTFEASHGGLEGTLLGDGCNGAGSSVGGDHILSLVVIKQGSEVRLKVASLGLVFIIQRWQSYYTVVVRMADMAFNSSYGILTEGCSSSDQLDVQTILTTSSTEKPSLKSRCDEACKVVKDSKVFSYNRACVFDCMTSQDEGISSMSRDFQSSLTNIEEEDATLPLNRPPSSASTLHIHWLLILTLSLTSLVKPGHA